MNDQKPPLLDRGLLGAMERSLFKGALTARRAAQIIAASTILITVAAGLAVWIFDHKEFDSLNEALWWALQTVTTVGYGDIVPKQTAGRLIGAVLMLNGIALISVVSAAVTASLIEQARRPRPLAAHPVHVVERRPRHFEKDQRPVPGADLARNGQAVAHRTLARPSSGGSTLRRVRASKSK